MLPELTPQQSATLDRLRSNGWTLDETTLHRLLCETAVAVKATGQSGMVMWFCIEPDGYAHT
jgi:hypothetical protein